ncbi:MAG: DsrE/DsrF/DrsH-like family protein [Thermaerobacter sp.]|nr:DsrE/DsrF/DrsH-like family protein [Thermaerobacter sp.]
MRALAKQMIIAIHGGLDEAYPPLILASTAAAMDMESYIFYTFYGLNVINRHLYDKLQVSPVGNAGMPVPGMPMPMPGAIIDNVGALPGMRKMATGMMKSMFKRVNMMSIPELVHLCIDSGVKIYPCQMTMDAFSMKKEDLVEGCQEAVGAATALEIAADCNIHWSF